MNEPVNVNGRLLPRHAVHFVDVAPLVRLATRNAVRGAEYADLSGDVNPRDYLGDQIAGLERLTEEQLSHIREVLDKCYGPSGHDWNDNDLCNRCGADGRA